MLTSEGCLLKITLKDSWVGLANQRPENLVQTDSRFQEGGKIRENILEIWPRIWCAKLWAFL